MLIGMKSMMSVDFLILQYETVFFYLRLQDKKSSKGFLAGPCLTTYCFLLTSAAEAYLLHGEAVNIICFVWIHLLFHLFITFIFYHISL